MERVSGTSELACPLCGNGVGARGCANCHLSLAEIRQYGRATRSGGRGRAVWTRFIGLVVYAGMVAWSWWFMPTVFLFVLPGAIVGGYLHTIRGRTIAGALACLTIVVIVPLLLLAAGFTGLFADVTGGH
jgi:hypothetical protein